MAGEPWIVILGGQYPTWGSYVNSALICGDGCQVVRFRPAEPTRAVENTVRPGKTPESTGIF